MADETPTAAPAPKGGNILSFLKGVPVLGGLAGDGIRTSGAAIFATVSAVILSLSLSAEVKAICLTALGVGWFIAGSIQARKAAAGLLLAAFALGGLSGCCSAEVKAHDDVLRGVVATHDAMDPDCLTPNPTPGQKALIDAARLQRQAAHRLVDGK